MQLFHVELISFAIDHRRLSVLRPSHGDSEAILLDEKIGIPEMWMWSGMSDLCSCWSGQIQGTTPPAETRANCTGGRTHCLCNLAKTRPLLSQPRHLVAIHNPARTPQRLPLELRVAQSGPNSLLNEGTLKFSHRTNDLKHEPTGRAGDNATRQRRFQFGCQYSGRRSACSLF